MKKQITIDGKQSDWFEKAVFVLKEKEVAQLPANLFLYAEHLVENQLKKNSYKNFPTYKPIDEQQGDYLVKKLQAECPKKRSDALKKKRRAQIIDAFLCFSISLCFICIMILLFKIYG